jgi:hypothetical protein
MRTSNIFLVCQLPTCLVYTYLLTPWSRVLLEKLNGFAACQEIPRIYGTRKFITVPTSARHLSLSWARSIQSPQPAPTSWRSHLRLCLLNGLVPSGFPTNNLCTPLPSPIGVTCPAHLTLLNFTPRTILGNEYMSCLYTCFLNSHWILTLRTVSFIKPCDRISTNVKWNFKQWRYKF